MDDGLIEAYEVSTSEKGILEREKKTLITECNHTNKNISHNNSSRRGSWPTDRAGWRISRILIQHKVRYGTRRHSRRGGIDIQRKNEGRHFVSKNKSTSVGQEKKAMREGWYIRGDTTDKIVD